jgi:hypothetical protein
MVFLLPDSSQMQAQGGSLAGSCESSNCEESSVCSGRTGREWGLRRCTSTVWAVEGYKLCWLGAVSVGPMAPAVLALRP